MVVCHVVSGLMYGGGQRVALDLVQRLGRIPGTRTLLVLLGDRIASGFPPFEQPWIQLPAYDGRYNRPASVGRAALKLRQTLRDHDVDIAHSHGWDADVIVGAARHGSKTRHVVHQHILADWASSARGVHRVRRMATRMALSGPRTRWVAVSSAVKESLQPLSWLAPASVRVIWNGVDLERFRAAVTLPSNPVPTIGVAARLAPMKGIEYLVEAVAELDRRGVTCKLRVVGDGPSRPYLESIVQSRGLSAQVSFVGHHEDMPQFYRSIDVLALPSVALEGLPLSILEGMATGLPVVSTHVSGIPEAVEHGKTGILVQPQDPHALADALEPLLRSSELRARMGQQGRRRVEALFSMERMVGQVAEVYRRAYVGSTET